MATENEQLRAALKTATDALDQLTVCWCPHHPFADHCRDIVRNNRELLTAAEEI